MSRDGCRTLVRLSIPFTISPISRLVDGSSDVASDNTATRNTATINFTWLSIIQYLLKTRISLTKVCETGNRRKYKMAMQKTKKDRKKKKKIG